MLHQYVIHVSNNTYGSMRQRHGSRSLAVNIEVSISRLYRSDRETIL